MIDSLSRPQLPGCDCRAVVFSVAMIASTGCAYFASWLAGALTLWRTLDFAASPALR